MISRGWKIATVLAIMLTATISITLLFEHRSNEEHHDHHLSYNLISELERLDIQFDQQILLMDSWHFLNYDQLNSTYESYRALLQQAAELPAPLNTQVDEIRDSLKIKFEYVERLKSINALLRNMLHYLPQGTQQLEQQLRMAEHNLALSRENSEYFRHQLHYQVISQFSKRLTSFVPAMELADANPEVLPPDLRIQWYQHQNLLEKISLYIGQNNHLVQAISKIDTAGKIGELNSTFSAYLQKAEEQSEQRQMLVMVYSGGAIAVTLLFMTIIWRYQVSHQEHLEHASTDHLTGLGNRRLLEKKLQVYLRKARFSKQPLGVLFIDLDGFKEVNDTLGHQRGDEVLQLIANDLKRSLRQDDLLVRFGGDEFVAVIYKASDKALSIIADNLINACTVECDEVSPPIEVSASIGISRYPQDTDDAEHLLQFADQAMYEAKQAGKKRSHFHQDPLAP